MITQFNKFNISESARMSDIKDKKDIYSEDTGFDTPKKINRSDKIVSKEILDQIENGITIEQLNNIDLPVFKYKTQITIHGQFDELTQSRIHGYKWIFQNKNKSIGVKWNAIDFNKKKLIYSVMKHIGYTISLTSNNYYAFKIVTYNSDNLKKLKEDYDAIDDSLYIGNKNLYVANSIFGKVIILEIRVKSIKEKDIWNFIKKSFDISQSEWQTIVKEKEKADAELRLKWKMDREIEKEKEKTQLEDKIKEFSKEYKIISFEDIPTEDCIMLYLRPSYLHPSEHLIKKYTDKNGKVKYQTMPYIKYNRDTQKDNINTRLRKYDKSEDYVEKLMSNNTIFLIKIFEGTGKKNNTKTKIETSANNSNLKRTNDLHIVNYSNKAIALFGDTRHLRQYLSKFGRWNKYLTNPETGKKEGGWIFSKYKTDVINKIIDKY